MSDTPPPRNPDESADEPCDRFEDALWGALRKVLGPPQSAHPGDLGQLGDYRLLKVLGRSGMGVVFEAFDTHLARSVAVKVIDPQGYRSDFIREWVLRPPSAPEAIDHPRIVPIYHVAVTGEPLFIVMPLLKGQSLLERLKTGPPLSIREVLQIGREVAEGLAVAHAHGLIHCNLKPRQIWLEGGPNGTHVRLLGIALARAAFASGGGLLPLTRTGVLWGTPAYMSPEQAEAKAVDARTDLWSLGVVLYELVARRGPFVGRGVFDTLAAITSESPPPLDKVAPDALPRLAALVDRLLSKDPARRPQSAIEVVEELGRIEAGLDSPKPFDISRILDSLGRLWRKVPDFAAYTINLWKCGKTLLAPTTPVASPASNRRIDENLRFAIYQPKAVRPAEWHTLLAFAHLSERPDDAPKEAPDPEEEVRRQVEQFLGAQAGEYQPTTRDTRRPIPRGDTLTFIPHVAGIEFNPPTRQFIWQEAIHREEFRLRPSAELDGTTTKGQMSVYLGSILVADVPLALRVDRAYSPKTEERKEITTARPYKKIFASYSHKDLEIVRQFEIFSRAIGDEYLRDWTHLRSGEMWNSRLLELIREADVFQLFWSSNAMRSAYVRQEWEYALSLNRPNFVRPTYWEVPMPASPDDGLPPPALQECHFHQLPTDLIPTPQEDGLGSTLTKPAQQDTPSRSKSRTRLYRIPIILLIIFGLYNLSFIGNYFQDYYHQSIRLHMEERSDDYHIDIKIMINKCIFMADQYKYEQAIEWIQLMEDDVHEHLEDNTDLITELTRLRQEVQLARDLDQIHRVNRGWRVDGVDKGFDFPGVARKYRDTFERYGFNVTTDSPEVVAAKVRSLKLRGQVISHLDDWRMCEPDPRRRDQVIRVLQLADPDSESARLFDPPPWLAPAPREVTPIAPPPRAITRP